MNSEALQSLNIIIDSKLISIGRCSNMVWLWFQKNCSIFVLHLQCPWRIIDGEHICIASGDIYSPSSIIPGILKTLFGICKVPICLMNI